MPLPPPPDATVVTNDPTVASRILQRLSQHMAVTPFQAGKFLARGVPLLRPTVTWADLKEAPNVANGGGSKSLLNCLTLVECGLALSDLYRTGLARDFLTLKDVFEFTPKALTINYTLLNVNVLRQLYRIDYEDFIVHFGVGPWHYLIDLMLPLSDLHAMGITSASMLMARQWPRIVSQAHTKRGLPPPDARRFNNEHMQRLLRPLDGKIFIDRHAVMIQRKSIDESPSDWARFLGMTAQDLLDLDLTLQDVARLWVPRYGSSVEKVLRTHFNATGVPLRDDIPQPQSRHRRRHRRHRPSSPSPNGSDGDDDDEDNSSGGYVERADTTPFSPLDRF